MEYPTIELDTDVGPLTMTVLDTTWDEDDKRAHPFSRPAKPICRVQGEVTVNRIACRVNLYFRWFGDVPLSPLHWCDGDVYRTDPKQLGSVYATPAIRERVREASAKAALPFMLYQPELQEAARQAGRLQRIARFHKQIADHQSEIAVLRGKIVDAQIEAHANGR